MTTTKMYYAKKDNQYYAEVPWGSALTENMYEASCFNSIDGLIDWLNFCDIDDYEIIENEQ